MKKILIYSIFSALLLISCKDKSEQQQSIKDTTQSKQPSESDELKKKELELKEKELNLKEKELEQQKERTELNSSQQERNTEYYRGGYGRFPEGSERYLNSSELYNFSQWDLKIMRNEIFARHGYIFQTLEMRDYFLKQNWYEPRYYDVNNMLSKVEKANIDLIKRFEK
jgi:hypothetical protein